MSTTTTGTVLEQLRTMTVVVADTGDIEAIQKVRPIDATTNPSLITAAAQLPQYQSIVDDTLKAAKAALGATATPKDVVTLAIDRLAVAFGLKILAIVPGRVSTEVDARLSYDTSKTIAKARELIGMYQAAGIKNHRVLIKIAATWEGIEAARQLEKEGIHCNLTLMFGLHQAIACADANVTLVSPFVGRILDWYKKSTGKTEYAPEEDPGVVSVTQIYTYYKHFGYKTLCMGASFRNVQEIIQLAGCDLLTISPQLLHELEAMRDTKLEKKLDVEKAKANSALQKIVMTKEVFDKMHDENKMAHDKLTEGIQGFSKALEQLEALLLTRLSSL